MFVRHVRVGESLNVGDIRIVLIRVKGQGARIGVEAPMHMPIRRLEPTEQIKQAVEEVNREWWDDLDPSEMPRF